VEGVFAALEAVFFERQFVLVLFFILLDAVVDVFANRASELHKLFGNSGHVCR
jgi:hypothetical protein